MTRLSSPPRSLGDQAKPRTHPDPVCTMRGLAIFLYPPFLLLLCRHAGSQGGTRAHGEERGKHGTPPVSLLPPSHEPPRPPGPAGITQQSVPISLVASQTDLPWGVAHAVGRVSGTAVGVVRRGSLWWVAPVAALLLLHAPVSSLWMCVCVCLGGKKSLCAGELDPVALADTKTPTHKESQGGNRTTAQQHPPTHPPMHARTSFLGPPPGPPRPPPMCDGGKPPGPGPFIPPGPPPYVSPPPPPPPPPPPMSSPSNRAAKPFTPPPPINPPGPPFRPPPGPPPPGPPLCGGRLGSGIDRSK